MLPIITVEKSFTQTHRIVPVFRDEEDPWRHLPEARRTEATATAKVREFTGKAGQDLLLAFGAEHWLFVGLGTARALTRTGFCEALGRAYNTIRTKGAKKVGVLLPVGLTWSTGETRETVQAVDHEWVFRHATEALLMAAYTFNDYRGKPEQRPAIVLTPEDPALHDQAKRGLKAGIAVGEAIALTRDLINHPAAVAHTGYLLDVAKATAGKAKGTAVEAKSTAGQANIRFSSIVGDELKAQGYGAIHTVGQSAENPPALVTLEYGTRGKGPTVALVGKGVTFDTGGLDMKSSSAMALMKKDVGGAATVLGAFCAIAALKVPLHVVAVLGLAENAVDARAFRPGDILRSKQGTTIEVTNTDSEGRLVLADAMALARSYQPEIMVDMATLTRACRVALGKQIMGLFCEDDQLREGLCEAGEYSGDMVWPLPMWAPYRKFLDSQVADIANAASDGFGGAINAALFLKTFAQGPHDVRDEENPGERREQSSEQPPQEKGATEKEIAWAHIDCYGWSDGDHPLFPKGGSGMGVRLLIEWAQKLAAVAD